MKAKKAIGSSGTLSTFFLKVYNPNIFNRLAKHDREREETGRCLNILKKKVFQITKSTGGAVLLGTLLFL